MLPNRVESSRSDTATPRVMRCANDGRSANSPLVRGFVPRSPQIGTARRPHHDDEAPLGLSFFRTEIRAVRLEHLTIPRPYFGRSTLHHVAIVECVLSESTINWCDLDSVDLRRTDLTSSDLRACAVVRTSIRNSDLRNPDLTLPSLKACDFTGARMDGVKLTKTSKRWKWTSLLTAQQRRVIEWQTQDGRAPGGG